jgi:class 3 adenylate cyclase
MGDGVNIAARLEGVCEPGSVCLSEQAYWQVKGRLDLTVVDLGPTQLKIVRAGEPAVADHIRDQDRRDFPSFGHGAPSGRPP